MIKLTQVVQNSIAQIILRHYGLENTTKISYYSSTNKDGRGWPGDVRLQNIG
jgi:hypothetical protein